MAGTKQRLNLLIDHDLLDRLQKLARQRELSISWLIRRGAELLLDTAAVGGKTSRRQEEGVPKRKLRPLDDPILKVIGIFEGPAGSSRAIDSELYKARPR